MDAISDGIIIEDVDSKHRFKLQEYTLHHYMPGSELGCLVIFQSIDDTLQHECSIEERFTITSRGL